MKFKTDDIVKVKENLVSDVYDDLFFPPEMIRFCGHKFIIEYTIGRKYILKPIPRKRYPKGVRADICWYYFNDEMLVQPYVDELSEFLRKEVICTK